MKKIILSVLLSFQVLLMTHAAPTLNGIIVYAEGQQTCCLFNQMPTVTYNYDGKDTVAQLSVEDIATPVVLLKLAGESKLVIEYGEVDEEASVKAVSIKQEAGKNGKYVVCGRLVIVKDGKVYNSDGTVVK